MSEKLDIKCLKCNEVIIVEDFEYDLQNKDEIEQDIKCSKCGFTETIEISIDYSVSFEITKRNLDNE